MLWVGEDAIMHIDHMASRPEDSQIQALVPHAILKSAPQHGQSHSWSVQQQQQPYEARGSASSAQ
eukprot:5226012-Pyramimonas_sp.AAC.1